MVGAARRLATDEVVISASVTHFREGATTGGAAFARGMGSSDGTSMVVMRALPGRVGGPPAPPVPASLGRRHASKWYVVAQN
ncbi:hypothetical protein GCM10009646_65150 [Streptomyces aureus]